MNRFSLAFRRMKIFCRSRQYTVVGMIGGWLVGGVVLGLIPLLGFFLAPAAGLAGLIVGGAVGAKIDTGRPILEAAIHAMRDAVVLVMDVIGILVRGR